MPTSARAIKRLATTLLNHREGFLVTRKNLLTQTADDLYDGFIKPLAKYGGAGKIISRFGIDEYTWKQVQQEIQRRPVTDEDEAVDRRVITEIQDGMRQGGCSEEDIANVG